MVRNLKILGLALAAVFALSAVAASAASAQVGTLTSTGPVTLIGTQTGGAGSNAFTATYPNGATKFECPIATYTGHKFNVTPHTLIPNDVSTFTVTPHYGTCVETTSVGTFPMTIDMNGCDYNFHLENTKIPGTDEYLLGVTITCPVGKHITMTLFSNAANHAAFKPFCHTTILEKATDYTGLTAKDTTNGLVDITGTLSGIKIEKSTGILCPSETDNNAQLHLDIAVEGKNEAGGKTNISISHL